jgi:serine/threonine protein kinase
MNLCNSRRTFVLWYALQDLSGGNVLLTSSAANAHGFTARVVDFGLARSLDVKARTAPGRYGTITHMAPETIREGELSIACDVYAWGVQLWEMITGEHRQQDCLLWHARHRAYGCRHETSLIQIQSHPPSDFVLFVVLIGGEEGTRSR